MKLHREILRLAGPSILAGITVPLVGMVDIAVAGHLLSGESATLIGGISVGTMLFDLLYWNFAFLRAGTGGLTAQAYGRGENARGILARALRVALLSGAALILLQGLAMWLAFLAVDCSPEVKQLATRYFRIRIWAAPATLSLFAFKGWFIGKQDSLRAMTADLLVNGLNIVLSVVLAFRTPLGYSGIAVGTVIAQWAGLAYCLAAARRRYGYVPLQEPVSKDKGFFRLNRDLILRSVGMIAVYVGFTMISASLGDMTLAVNSILMKLLMLFSYFVDGFAYAGEALTGRYFGERRADGIRATVRQTFAWSLAVAAAFMLLYGPGGVPMLQLMSADAAVVEAARPLLPWLLLMPLMGCPAFVWDGIFTGATAGADLRRSALLGAVGFFGVWLATRQLMPAYFAHLAVRALYLTLRWVLSISSDISSPEWAG